MTKEEQRFAIAEACGWKEYPTCFDSERKVWGRSQAHADSACRGRMVYCLVPDYHNDLNAMREAESTLMFDQQTDYIHFLAGTWTRSPGAPNQLTLNECWYITRATATQRAEAFLRTIGKWKD